MLRLYNRHQPGAPPLKRTVSTDVAAAAVNTKQLSPLQLAGAFGRPVVAESVLLLTVTALEIEMPLTH